MLSYFKKERLFEKIVYCHICIAISRGGQQSYIYLWLLVVALVHHLMTGEEVELDHWMVDLAVVVMLVQ